MNRLFLLLIFSILSLSSCKNSSGPKQAAKEYLAAIDNFDYEKAKQFIIPDENNTTTLRNIKNWSDKMTTIEKDNYTADKKVYNFIEEDVTDNSAKVIATNNQGQFTVVIEFEMAKKDGKWLIEKIVDK